MKPLGKINFINLLSESSQMSYNSVILNSAFAVYKLAPGQEILPHVAKGHGKEKRFEEKSNFITMLLFS